MDLSFNVFHKEAAKQLFTCVNYISSLALKSCGIYGGNLLYLKQELEKDSYEVSYPACLAT